MKKIIRKTVVVLFILMLIFLQYEIFAINASDLKPKFTAHSNGFKNFGGAVLGYIRNIAAISSVILITVFGLRFMVGSVEQKAEYKKHFLPLIVGIAVVLSATTITKVVWDIAGKQTGTSECTHSFESFVKQGKTYLRCEKCGIVIEKKGEETQ